MYLCRAKVKPSVCVWNSSTQNNTGAGAPYLFCLSDAGLPDSWMDTWVKHPFNTFYAHKVLYQVNVKKKYESHLREIELLSHTSGDLLSVSGLYKV